MADDPVGVRQDGIVTGQRCQDVRFDPDTAEGFVQQDAPQDRRDGERSGTSGIGSVGEKQNRVIAIAPPERDDRSTDA